MSHGSKEQVKGKAPYRADLSWLKQTIPPLPDPMGKVVHVSTVSELSQAVDNVEPGTTIMVADGVYQLESSIVLKVDGITLRGASNDRSKVVLLGDGFHGERSGPSQVVYIQEGKNITLANLTIKECSSQGLSVQGETGPLYPHIYNVAFIDIGQRSIKVTAAGKGYPNADYGIVEYCYAEQIQSIPVGRNDGFEGEYVGGIDAHGIKGWKIRNNIFMNIRGAAGSGRGAIFVWNNSSDTIVENNLIIGCDRGIAIGNPHGPNEFARDGEEVYHHTDGIVRNNFVYSRANKTNVELVKVRGLKFINNTIVNENPEFDKAVTYSFPVTRAEICNNLVHGGISSLVDGQAELKNNLTGIPISWFKDPKNGDLSLTEEAKEAMGAGLNLEEVPNDFFGNPRTKTFDVGAHQVSK